MTRKITDKKFQCPECEQMFATKTGLGSHRRSRHGVAGTSEATLQYHAQKNMSTKKCPECGETFKTPQALGLHKRTSHGIEGQHHTTLYAKRREAALRGELVSTIDPNNLLQCQECGLTLANKAGFSVHVHKNHPNYGAVAKPVATPTTNGKRKYTRREIEQPAQAYAAATIVLSQNGASPQESHAPADGIPDATLALALGRFQGLCTSMAAEFDLPPRMFASRLAELIYRSQVR